MHYLLQQRLTVFVQRIDETYNTVYREWVIVTGAAELRDGISDSIGNTLEAHLDHIKQRIEQIQKMRSEIKAFIDLKYRGLVDELETALEAVEKDLPYDLTNLDESLPGN